jgi:hypothetical protein
MAAHGAVAALLQGRRQQRHDVVAARSGQQVDQQVEIGQRRRFLQQRTHRGDRDQGIGFDQRPRGLQAQRRWSRRTADDREQRRRDGQSADLAVALQQGRLLARRRRFGGGQQGEQRRRALGAQLLQQPADGVERGLPGDRVAVLLGTLQPAERRLELLHGARRRFGRVRRRLGMEDDALRAQRGEQPLLLGFAGGDAALELGDLALGRRVTAARGEQDGEAPGTRAHA